MPFSFIFAGMHQLNHLFNHEPSPIEQIKASWAEQAGVALYIKRDELLRMGSGLALCGNKWRKLKYNLLAAESQGLSRLLTFGGAYSNHIAAVAAAGQAFGFDTVGIIRGEQPEILNPTLQMAISCGMQLVYVSRAQYRLRHDAGWQEQLLREYGPFYLLPEGGTNDLALKGAAELARETEQQQGSFDYYCLSAGTGGTMAGLIQGCAPGTTVLGFSALKGSFLQKEVSKLLGEGQEGVAWEVINHYHFGGYAKHQEPLLRYIRNFYQAYGIPLDPIYTGKMLYGLQQEIEQGRFPAGSRILALHTGGLQGILGFNERYGMDLPTA